MPQTPQQRRANLKYAKKEEAKKGRPQSEYAPKKRGPLPVSVPWLSKYRN
jgi:Ribosome associated membrane protein RAMP4